MAKFQKGHLGFWKGKHPPHFLGNTFRRGAKHTEATIQKMKVARLGKKLSLETKKKMAVAHEGEKNYAWKGENVSYSGLHIWVAKKLGKPKFCAYCQNDSKSARSYHWANISHAYKRELSDWIRLCVSCHSNYDRGKIQL